MRKNNKKMMNQLNFLFFGLFYIQYFKKMKRLSIISVFCILPHREKVNKKYFQYITKDFLLKKYYKW